MPGAPSEDASMVSIIPLAAFSDNYVWAIRSGDRVVVVDPEAIVRESAGPTGMARTP